MANNNKNKNLPQSMFDSFNSVSKIDVKQTLQEKFLIPPFSVLDGRQGYWQSRKAYWVNRGVKGETGRSTSLTFRIATDGASTVSDKLYTEKAKDKKDFYADMIEERGGGSSIFDPVLCELVYKWWCPKGGSILDPFAGEATKGVLASALGYEYTGVEIRQEQVDANYQVAKDMGLMETETPPSWIVGDSGKLLEVIPPGKFYDMVFTSPPYYNLEQYDLVNEQEISHKQSYFSFMIWYELIFKQSVSRLKTGRFLVIKIGEVRGKNGFYVNFLGDNITCFLHCGLKYYNELVLITPIGSLPVRTASQFPSKRKIGKGHQNVLVFYKGQDTECLKEVFKYNEDSGDANGSGDSQPVELEESPSTPI